MMRKLGLGPALGRLCGSAPGLVGAQGGTSPSEPRHQRSDRNAESRGGLLVGKALDRHEVQRRPLVVGQAHEGGLDLLEPDPAFLFGRNGCLDRGGSLFEAPSFRQMPAAAIDERVVHDREQPAAQVSACAEGALPLIGAHERILHQILRLGLVAGQRSRIAAQRAEQADDIRALRIVHDRYTKLGAIFIRTRAGIFRSLRRHVRFGAHGRQASGDGRGKRDFFERWNP